MRAQVPPPGLSKQWFQPDQLSAENQFINKKILVMTGLSHDEQADQRKCRETHSQSDQRVEENRSPRLNSLHRSFAECVNRDDKTSALDIAGQ